MDMDEIKVCDWRTFNERLDDGDITAREVEAYIEGIFLVMGLVGCDTVGKSYDPLVIDEHNKVAHSYQLNLWDGGRHHPYESLDTLARTARFEFIVRILAESERKIGKGAYGYLSHGTDSTAVERLKLDYPEVFEPTPIH